MRAYELSVAVAPVFDATIGGADGNARTFATSNSDGEDLDAGTLEVPDGGVNTVNMVLAVGNDQQHARPVIVLFRRRKRPL